MSSPTAVTVIPLPTGADVRVRNAPSASAVVLVNGGTARAVPGTWSATSELLAQELAPRFTSVRFAEVRYRLKTWNALESCIRDADGALDLLASQGVTRCLLVGFSMGGAVSIGVADHGTVEGVLGLAPWIPDRLPVEALAGKRLDVVHGALDRGLPGVPGVSPAHSRHGFERVRRLGAAGTYTTIAGGLHGAALRRPDGSLFRLPRWRRWVEEVGASIERFDAR